LIRNPNLITKGNATYDSDSIVEPGAVETSTRPTLRIEGCLDSDIDGIKDIVGETGSAVMSVVADTIGDSEPMRKADSVGVAVLALL
jgi:hypothetical protein